jgi:hypothetical protein
LLTNLLVLRLDIDLKIAEIITQRIAAEGQITSRELGRLLQGTLIRPDNSTTSINALTALKTGHNSLRNFLESLYDQFDLEFPKDTYPEFIVKLASDDDEDEDSVDDGTTDKGSTATYNYNDNDEQGPESDEDVDIKVTAAQGKLQETTNDGLEDLTKQRLVTMARDRGLRLTGLKSDLIRRIRDHDSSSQPSKPKQDSSVSDASTSSSGASEESVLSQQQQYDARDLRKPVQTLDDVIRLIKDFIQSVDNQKVIHILV